ncbi:MAG: hypothetical protein QME68_07685 [Elusimicrobiota bacterium]|nr:hypothetical protein [Elusimicrobiota bacterium]
MKKIITLFIISFAVLLFSLMVLQALFASSVNVPVGAYIPGIGDAGTSVVHEESICYNPANIAILNKKSLVASWQSWYGDTEKSHLLLINPFKTNQTVGGYILYSKTGGIEEWSDTNQYIGTSNYNSLVAGVSLGQLISDFVCLGGTVKFTRDTFKNYTVISKNTFDFGVLYRIRDFLNVGVAIRNVSSQDDQNIKLGVSLVKDPFGYSLYPFILSVDYHYSFEYQSYAAAGVDIPFLYKGANLRLGYKTLSQNLTLGFGFAYKDYNIDYVYVTGSELGSVNRISFVWRFKDVPEHRGFKIWKKIRLR